VKAGHSLETLNDIETSEVRIDGHLFAARKGGGDRGRSAEQGFAPMDSTPGADGSLRDPPKVLRLKGDNDVGALRAAYDAPGVEGESAYHDELDSCLG